MAGNEDSRWVVLAQDGSHATLGRHRQPDEADLVRASEGLERLGLAGWFVLLEGDYWGGDPPVLRMLRPLTGREGDWNAAVAAFLERRKR